MEELKPCTLCEQGEGVYQCGIEVICKDCLEIIQDNEKWLYGEVQSCPSPKLPKEEHHVK